MNENEQSIKKGSESMVAKLQKNADIGFHVDEKLPYAELWMGTHVNAPSAIKQTNEKLSDFIKTHPECLGEKVTQNFNQELPFLFKVLSVNKALSIQAHPSKGHAEKLHYTFPNIYKDPNHKPEMAIALTPFEALCGFRPIDQIKTYVEDIPELKMIVGCKEYKEEKTWIQKAFRAVLTCEKVIVRSAIDSMLKRYETIEPVEKVYYYEELLRRLQLQFPYDNGILMVYFLNYLMLEPSEAIFLGANEPHAYLFGDCVECMACSDNVVRAGLTPKLVDVETLCDMLTYQGAEAASKLFGPQKEDDFSIIFKPPVPDFAVASIKVPTSQMNYTTPRRVCASIMLVISGQADYENGSVVAGTVLFIPADQSVNFTNLKEELVMYQALANV